ncbi:hypothetical protein LAZ67_16002621 [Cordylochernes scorpioides]|uniref:Tc1-like transposase DDE domain-containing protein n=1 Tax=Cordylochernes scorpioides TaxID=51811 RepID=A0ABY6LC42_9ARAC|nr:hypothetical protein LAZ67_16002621 [Cordylochernes scorpioides]
MEHRDTTTIVEIQENDQEQMTGDLTDKNGSKPGDHLIEEPPGEARERLLESCRTSGDHICEGHSTDQEKRFRERTYRVLSGRKVTRSGDVGRFYGLGNFTLSVQLEEMGAYLISSTRGYDNHGTSPTVSQHIQSVTHHPVSAGTIRRRLQHSGLSARRPLLRLHLTQNHRRLHRQWCDERRMWTAEWNEIVFTDESRFCLQHHDSRILVWIHRGERKLNSCGMHRHTGPSPGIMVWGGIGYHSRTPLVRIAGTLKSQRCISEVLEPVVFPFLQALPTTIFQQDNARPHVARIVQRFFVNRQIKLLPWPARSPDLSPIENMWSMVAQRLTQITSPAATPDQLWQRVEDSWSTVPQEHIQSLFESMPRRVAAFARFKAGRTSVKDDLHTGRPLSIRNPENALKIKTYQTLIKNDLHLKRSPAKFVPHLLMNEQKEHRKETGKNMVEMFNSDPHWLKNVITGDETWGYGYEPETKRQSS